MKPAVLGASRSEWKNEAGTAVPRLDTSPQRHTGMTGETFNQKRMDRCLRIATAITENWRKTNSFTYTVRATQAVHGLSLDDLRTHYFAVVVGGDLTDLPFVDLLVVFSIIEQEAAALRTRTDKTAKNFKLSFQITTDWPDEEAVRLLSRIRIETPHDPGLPQEKWSRSYGCFGLWVRSYSTGDKNPSDECRRTRL